MSLRHTVYTVCGISAPSSPVHTIFTVHIYIRYTPPYIIYVYLYIPYIYAPYIHTRLFQPFSNLKLGFDTVHTYIQWGGGERKEMG